MAEGKRISADAKPSLPRGVRLVHNEVQGGWVLLASLADKKLLEL